MSKGVRPTSNPQPQLPVRMATLGWLSEVAGVTGTLTPVSTIADSMSGLVMTVQFALSPSLQKSWSGFGIFTPYKALLET